MKFLVLLGLLSANAMASQYTYTCYQMGDQPSQFVGQFKLEVEKEMVVLRRFLFNNDLYLPLVDIDKKKAKFFKETYAYMATVVADDRLRSGGYKTPEGTYVGSIEVTYDDYREEYTHAYFCKRYNSKPKPKY